MSTLTLSPSDRSQPFADLNEQMHQIAEEAGFLGRFWKTMKLVKEQEGYLAATAVSVGIATATVYVGGASYFCLEGAGRSLEETYWSLKKEKKLVQAVGDAGGWMALPIFSFYAFSSTLKQFSREGDFAEVQQICQKWYRDIPSDMDISKDEFYSNINGILDAIAPQCLIQKSLVSRRLIALNIIEDLMSEKADPLLLSSPLYLDQQLKPLYQKIEKERQRELRFPQYFHRLRTGLSITRAKYGTLTMLGNAVSGIAVPIVLSIATLFSAIGEVELGKKVLGENKDLPERGHFGEWPDNLIESSIFAFFLNRDLMLKGDIHLLTGIFHRHLNNLRETDGKQDLHNRLCEVANAELQYLCSNCFFSQVLQLNVFQPI